MMNKIFFVVILILVGNNLFAQEDNRTELEKIRDEILGKKVDVVEDSVSLEMFDRKSLKDFSTNSIISNLIEPKLAIMSSAYIIEDKEGNRYIDRNNKDNSFHSLGVNVDDGYILSGNISLNPWLIDSTYEEEKGFIPSLVSNKYKLVNQKERDKPNEEAYIAIDEKYLVSNIDQESGISIKKYTEPKASKGEDLLLVSVGLNRNKVQVYYDSYNEVIQNLKLDPTVFFDQYYGSAIFQLYNESDQIKVSLVGVIGYEKDKYVFQKIGSSDIKKIEKAKEKMKGKKKKSDKKKKKKNK